MTSAIATKAKTRRRPWWISQPSTAFLRDPHFYTKYDLVWATLLVVLSATLWFGVGWRGFDVAFSLANAPLLVGLFLVASYVHIMCHVFTHNGAHENFPRPINRLWSELTGAVIATRFASWEVLHRYHHMHTDDTTLDPHPVNRGFWRFFFAKMIFGLEKNLRHQYLERWGDTPETRARDARRTILSGITGVILIGTWFVIFGPVMFFAVFLPGLVVGTVHVSHFNWITHHGDGDGADYRPTNLDHGVYWFANRVLFGLYMHANHHAYLKLFNPLKIPANQAERVDKKIRSHRVSRGLSE